MSRPARARGLKLRRFRIALLKLLSRPARARGLKLLGGYNYAVM